jgi:hypothetical protein
MASPPSRAITPTIRPATGPIYFASVDAAAAAVPELAVAAFKKAKGAEEEKARHWRAQETMARGKIMPSADREDGQEAEPFVRDEPVMDTSSFGARGGESAAVNSEEQGAGCQEERPYTGPRGDG